MTEQMDLSPAELLRSEAVRSQGRVDELRRHRDALLAEVARVEGEIAGLSAALVSLKAGAAQMDTTAPVKAPVPAPVAVVAAKATAKSKT